MMRQQDHLIRLTFFDAAGHIVGHFGSSGSELLRRFNNGVGRTYVVPPDDPIVLPGQYQVAAVHEIDIVLVTHQKVTVH